MTEAGGFSRPILRAVKDSGTNEGSHPHPTVEDRRAALRLSREELAALAGLSPRTIYNLEHGLRSPHRATRAVLAAVLGCESAELAFNRDDPPERVVSCGRGATPGTTAND